SHSLLVLLSSLSYVNHLKERLLVRQHPESWAKAGAKVRTFSKTANIFETFFQKQVKKVVTIDLNQPRKCLHLIIL
ncbi:MAG: hypothetical protein IJ190_04285, partial [Prevotella sp.]|nr:hypothetical protein [Prevotella sp.]